MGPITLAGLRALPPHEVDERAGLTVRIDPRVENFGRDVVVISLKAPVLEPNASEAEVYGERNSFFAGVC